MMRSLLNKATAVLTSFALLIGLVPIQPSFADYDLTVNYLIPQGAKLETGEDLLSAHFHHIIETRDSTGNLVVAAEADGDGTLNGFMSGYTYTLRVTSQIPVGYSLPHTVFPLNLNDGPNSISITVLSNAPTSADLTVRYANLPNGYTSGQFHHQLFDSTGNTDQQMGADGDGTLNGVPNGNYLLKVTTIPSGVTISNAPATVNIQGQPVEVVFNVVANAPTVGDLTVNYTVPQGVSTALFHHQLFSADGLTDTERGADGNGTLNGIDAGNYQIKATSSDAAYIVSPTPQNITIVAGQTTTVNFTVNVVESRRGDLDVAYENLPRGVSSDLFHHEIFDETGTKLLEYGADGDGVLNDIDAGTYMIKVTSMPPRTTVRNSPQIFTIKGDQVTIVRFTVVATPPGTGDLRVEYSGLDLDQPSGEFQHLIFYADGTPEGSEAGGNGTLNGLRPGDYIIKVSKMPAGFTVRNSSQEFTIKGGETTVVTFDVIRDPNAPATGSVFVEYLGLDRNTPSALFRHKIFANDGTTSAEAGGTGTLNDLAVGNYNLSVNTVPAEFCVKTNPIPFKIEADATTHVQVEIGDLVNGVCEFSGGNGGGEGGGGGGGGGNRPGEPTISFMSNQRTVTSLSVTPGQLTTITVIANDTSRRTLPVTLTLKTDPTTTKNSKATFTVLSQGTSSVTGTLTWTPGTDSLGLNNFVFNATNGSLERTETLAITVTSPVTGGGGGTVTPGVSTGGGGGGGGGVFIFPTVKKGPDFSKCEFNDNDSEAVVYLCMLGIIDKPVETKDKKFFTRDNIDRAALTKMMVMINYSDADITPVGEEIVKKKFYSFPDVDPTAWFAKFITIAQLDNVVSGYPDSGKFIPWNNVTISEAVKIVSNSAANDNNKIRQDLKGIANKLDNEPWFASFALLMYSYGGYTPNLDNGLGDVYGKKLTRQQAADLIYTTILNAGEKETGKLAGLKAELTKLTEELKKAQAK